jgi:anti-anti-sigma factor
MATVANFQRLQAGDVLCLVVKGELDFSNHELFSALLQTLLEESDRVEVDLEQVTFLSSDAIGALIVASDIATERGVRLTVVGSPTVLRMLELSGLEELLALCV